MRRWSWAPPPARRGGGGSAVGLTVAVGLALFGRPGAGVVVASVAGAVAIAGVVAPAATDRALATVGRVAGRAVGVLTLTPVFYLAIVPLRWLRGGDPLGLGFPCEGSGWKARPPQAPDARRRWS